MRRPPRPGAGVVDDAGAEGARRARRCRRRRRSGRARARRGERGVARARHECAPRTCEVLREFARQRAGGQARDRFGFRFLRSPVAIHGDERVSRRSSSCATGSRSRTADSSRVPTDEHETTRVRARLPQRRLPRRRAARACLRRAARHDPRTSAAASSVRRRPSRVYCAGWIKRGPTGIIGTNKKDATETVELLLEDVRSRAASRTGAEVARRPPSRRCSPSADVGPVVYPGWTSIDELERRPRGEAAAGRA